MTRSHEIPDFSEGPPPEVLDEVAAAWERAQEPLPDDGELMTAISASEALAIACGDARMAVAV